MTRKIGSGLAETLTLVLVVPRSVLVETVLFVKMEKKNLLTTDTPKKATQEEPKRYQSVYDTWDDDKEAMKEQAELEAIHAEVGAWTVTEKKATLFVFEELARKVDSIYAESIKLDHDGDDTYVCSVLEHLSALSNELARLAGAEDVTEFYPKWQERRITLEAQRAGASPHRQE